MSSNKFFNQKEKSSKKEKVHKKQKPCDISCCVSEKPIDCCTPQYIILDKLRQGWSDVATTGGENIPKDLSVQYSLDIINDDASGNILSTATVQFNSVYDRAGNKVLFPGSGDIIFNYETYLDVSGNSQNISVDWEVPNEVYGNTVLEPSVAFRSASTPRAIYSSFLNLGSVNASLTLYGKYYSYFYYTVVDGSGSFLTDTSGSNYAITSIRNDLYQGWRGMSWSEFIANQIPYSGNSVNNNSIPDFGFGNSATGVYIPPGVIPTGANFYSQVPTGSYDIIYDNTLWAYLFVNTHRYVEVESCGKLDQVLGWYVNIYTNQLALLQNLYDLELTTQDNLAYLINQDIESLTPIELKKLKELNKFYNISLTAITKVKSDPKEQGNIIVIDDKCLGKWLVAINNAKSNVCWTDNSGEYVIVMTKLC
jgi:hypothetical protein